MQVDKFTECWALVCSRSSRPTLHAVMSVQKRSRQAVQQKMEGASQDPTRTDITRPSLMVQGFHYNKYRACVAACVCVCV